jgi:DNA repair protein RadC
MKSWAIPNRHPSRNPLPNLVSSRTAGVLFNLHALAPLREKETMKPKFNTNYKGIRCRVCLVRENTDSETIQINNDQAAYELVKEELAGSDREIFLSIMLTGNNDLIGVETVSIGSITECTAMPREIFKSAILANAVSVILCHNHPSGDLKPSKEDVNITKRLIEAGELLRIKVQDHLIVSHKGFYSLRDCQKFAD